MDGYIGFHAALRRSYYCFIQDLSKQCKKLIRHHLDSVTSPYSQVCYEKDLLGGLGSNATFTYRINQPPTAPFFLELSDGASVQETTGDDQENIPPTKQSQQTPPGKGADTKDSLRECQMTVPETPSPDQPGDVIYGAKDQGKGNEIGGRKRHARNLVSNRNAEHNRIQNGSLLFASSDVNSRSGSAYSEICSSAAQHFARIREVLIERSVLSTLNSGFLTPCRDRLLLALGLDLFAVNDEKFMDMFVAPGAADVLQNEHQSLLKRQKILQSCLTEFKTIARTL